MSHVAYGNRILQALTKEELTILAPHLEEVSVRSGVILTEAGQPARHLFFPVTAVLCLCGTTERGATVDVALVGREGVASVSAVLGRKRVPFRVVAQLAGKCWRIPTDVVVRQLPECRQLNELLLAYSHTVIAQVGQSAICNRFHTAKQRLARWLLMTTDRVDSNHLPLTHEFIAHMVGGPRSAVTEAASALRAAGAIDYRRGRITIQNVQTLRLQACECYEAAKDHSRR
jgi:CRP-like cAMP-binding protein